MAQRAVIRFWFSRASVASSAAYMIVMLLPALVEAQVAPNKHYYTLRTPHFYIHFTAATEPTARRVAVDAERAYAELASELHPPRGPIDVVISDDTDFSNGSATPFPTNRIVVYANPPIQNSSLRFTDDWGAMVITHELTHIFHLDRSRGIWRLGQYVFGRSPYLFPNEYAPAWLTEGLAVYYESRYTGAGRIEGSEHRMIARASAIDHSFPALGQVSLATPSFPFGEAAYAYGSLFVDYLTKTRGADRVRRFVEKESADLIPFWIDLPARQGFGISFTRAYRDWRDSVFRSVAAFGAQSEPIPGWRDITRSGIFASFPRWQPNNELTYTGGSGKEVYAAWRVDPAKETRDRIGRRNSESPQVPMPNGDLLYAQLDFTSPYEIRSDLFVQHAGRERRLTRGARLSVPDARADGAIVAVQTIPGGTRLVRVSPDGRAIVPITRGGLDEQWNEPRWSHHGDRIAAIRWRRSGISEVVIIDSLGREQGVLASGHSIQATPSWARDDGAVFYSSDRTGTAQIYLTTLGDRGERRLSDAPAGLFEPEPRFAVGAIVVDGNEPVNDKIAAVALRGDGYHLGVAPCCNAPSLPAPAIAQQGAVPTPPDSVNRSPATAYSPWRQLLPRYWTPSFGQGMHDGRPRIGAETGANDVIGRHAWAASIAVPTDNSGVSGGVAYSYSGLGMPVLDFLASRDWSLVAAFVDQSAQRNLLGEVRRRIDDGEVDATWIRRRYRSSFAVTTGAGAEQYRYVGVPNGTIALIDSTGVFTSRFYPRVLLGVGYARTQAAPFSISPEDGFTIAATARERWRTDIANTNTLSLVSAAMAYKSLDLPGFAHHVLALRAVGGVRDNNATDYFSVGGASGSPVPIIAGYTVGEGHRDFFVRGFDAGALVGTEAFAASAEYRLPLVKPGTAIGLLPLFVQRSSLNFFSDFGSAWCASVTTKLVCTRQLEDRFHLTMHRWLGSYGAELNVNAAVLSWDAPYRFRFGVAAPYHDDGLFVRAKSVSAYFASGLAF